MSSGGRGGSRPRSSKGGGAEVMIKQIFSKGTIYKITACSGSDKSLHVSLRIDLVEINWYQITVKRKTDITLLLHIVVKLLGYTIWIINLKITNQKVVKLVSLGSRSNSLILRHKKRLLIE